MLVLLWGHLAAQEPSAYHLKWVQLPSPSASRNITDVFQDRYGVLWIGTRSGLYHYDGISVQAHRLSTVDTVLNCPIRAVQEDEAGNLWVATANGLKIMNPTRSRLLPFAALNLPDSFEKLQKVNVTNGPDGSLYAAFGRDVFQYCSGELKLKYTLQVAGNYDPHLFKYSPEDRLIWMNNESSIASRLILLEEKGGIVQTPPLYDEKQQLIADWINVDNLLFHVSADSVVFFLILRKTNQPERFSKLEYDSAHRCFIYRDELRRNSNIQQQLNFMQDFMQKNQLMATGTESGFTISISYRFLHHIEAYISTEGLFILQPKQDYFRPVKASLGKRIRAIQGDRFGHLMYGTYNGTYWQHPEEAQAHLLDTGYLHWNITPLGDDRTRFFVEEDKGYKFWTYIRGTNTGVWLEQEKVIPSPKLNHINISYFGLAEDTLRKGIWHYLHEPEYNYFQLLFYDNKEDKHYYLNKIGDFHPPRCMVSGKDLWLAGYFGLKRFVNPDPKSGSLREDNSKIPEVFKNSPILTLYADANEQIWICPDSKGLFRYQPDSGQYEQFTSSEGLPDNSVYSILGEPGDSVLWLGTGKGLSKFDVKRRIFENYYTKDGLTHNEFNTSAAYRAPDGTMYMGGQNGIISFHPDAFRNISSALRQTAHVNLTGSSGITDVQQYILSKGNLLQVSPSVQLIQITFHTDDYLHAEQQQFRYRIPGVIDQWQTLGYSDKALFPYLPTGKHILEVQTQTHRGMWLPPVFYTLDVLPPWYKTWWFRTLVLSSIAGMLYGLYRLRIRQLRQEFSLRQQISHDLHDELGSRIYLLRALSQKITNPLASETDKKSNLDRFEETSQEAFKSIRDFIWAFNPKQDEAQQLFDRLEDFAENYLTPVIDTVKIHRSNIPQGIKIGPRTKHHLMNIYQELLTNMVKHTQSESIDISLVLLGNKITIEIRNQHKGYKGQKPAQTELKAGQESLQRRLEEINAKLVWEEPDSGLQTVKIKANI